MHTPLSIRLDDDVRSTLLSEAEMRGVGLSSYVRQLAEAEAARLRRERIRAASEAVARHITASPDAQTFCEDWASASGFSALSD